jgi:hypothetical protein
VLLYTCCGRVVLQKKKLFRQLICTGRKFVRDHRDKAIYIHGHFSGNLGMGILFQDNEYKKLLGQIGFIAGIGHISYFRIGFYITTTGK